MDKLINLLINNNYLEENDVNNRGFDFTGFVASIAGYFGRILLGFFIILTILPGIILTGQYKFAAIVFFIISLVVFLIFSDKFLPSFNLPISLIIAILIFDFNSYKFAITCGFLLYLFIAIIKRNKVILNLLLMIFYIYLFFMFGIDSTFGFNIVNLISIINFSLIFILIIKEDYFRKTIFSKNITTWILSLLLISLCLSCFYEVLNINRFLSSNKYDKFLHIQNILYIIGNIYILTRIKKNINSKLWFVNIVLSLISLKIPIIVYSLFLYNLAIYYQWMALKKIGLILIIIGTFLLYHSFATSFLIKSIITGFMGLIMLISYYFIEKRGDNFVKKDNRIN